MRASSAATVGRSDFSALGGSKAVGTVTLHGNTALWLCLLFFTGYGAGLTIGRFYRLSPFEGWAALCLNPASYANAAQLFAALFLAAVLQLTLLVVFAFGVLAFPLSAFLFLLKGALLGMLTITLYQSAGAKGLLVYWILLWPGELAVLVILLRLAQSAAALGSSLRKSAHGVSAAMPSYAALANHCLTQYAASLFFAVLFCSTSAWAATFLSPLFL